MAAQFGGKQYVEGQKEPIMKMPSDFMDFIRVLIPMSGSDNAMEGEQINKYGNHVGSWNIGLTGYVQDWRIKAYYEHFFEDESQMFFGYGPWKDGLLGVEVTLPENQFIDALVYECMGSKTRQDLSSTKVSGENLNKSVQKIIIITTIFIRHGSIGVWLWEIRCLPVLSTIKTVE